MSKDRSEPPSIPIKPTQAQQPSTSSRAHIEAFLGQVRALDPAVKARERGRLRARRYDEPTTYLGPSLSPSGGDVSRSGR